MKKLAINPSNKKYYSDDYIKGWEDGVKAQYEATKDAVEVVRCKDCKHRYVYETNETGMATNYYVCDFMDAQYEDNGFCHHGEKA